MEDDTGGLPCLGYLEYGTDWYVMMLETSEVPSYVYGMYGLEQILAVQIHVQLLSALLAHVRGAETV